MSLIGNIDQSLNQIRNHLASRRPFLNYPDRMGALQKIEDLIKSNLDKILEALYLDLGRNRTESFLAEVQMLLSEIQYIKDNLQDWMSPTRVHTPLILWPASAKVIAEPKGLVLVIAPWNYPFLLALGPVLSAISAGNSVVLKPSEVAQNTSKLLCQLINTQFDLDQIFVIEGGVSETTQILEFPFDHIFYTGNGQVGKVILQAAAKNLTPVTLELGGKSPVIVIDPFDIKRTSQRIAWGKSLNAGQTCVAPDYVLVPHKYKDQLIQAIGEAWKCFYGDSVVDSADYARIINQKHFDRILSWVDPSKVVWGGKHDRLKLFIEPTLIDLGSVKDPQDSRIMSEEIFGPILPILSYQNIDDATEFVQKRGRPLALYLFGQNLEGVQDLSQKISAGGVCINDTVVHLAHHGLPFGGVGESGYGAYHGKTGFDQLSHHKGVLVRGTWFEAPLRFPPYKVGLGWIQKILAWLNF